MLTATSVDIVSKCFCHRPLWVNKTVKKRRRLADQGKYGWQFLNDVKNTLMREKHDP